jgi:hypothetical protein
MSGGMIALRKESKEKYIKVKNELARNKRAFKTTPNEQGFFCCLYLAVMQ